MAFNIIFTALSFSSETEKKESKNQKKESIEVENKQKGITESPVCILSLPVCVVVPQVIVENCCNARLNIVQILLSCLPATS